MFLVGVAPLLDDLTGGSYDEENVGNVSFSEIGLLEY